MSTPKKTPAIKANPPPIETNATPLSPAKQIQAISVAPHGEFKIATTLRMENGFEYHLDLARSVIDGILDPDVPDVFIEVPCAVRNTRRFTHTAFIKEVDVLGLEA